MSDEEITHYVDYDYIASAYENGLEGAHFCIAEALSSLNGTDWDIEGLTAERWQAILNVHVQLLENMALQMLKEAKPPDKATVTPIK